LRHNYSKMNNIEDILILIGMGSVALLWAFSLGGALAVAYDTVRAPIDGLIKRIKGYDATR